MVTMTATATPIVVPAELDLGDDDFLADEGLEATFWDVVQRYERLSVITDHDISVKVIWKKKGGKSQGKQVAARCVKTSGLVKHFGASDFVIWLAADYLAASGYTRDQICKLLYPEARHIGWLDPDSDKEDDEGKPIILGHDVELFLDEVTETGAWEHFRRALGSEFRQAGLFSER